MQGLEKLIERWRDEADTYERRGLQQFADFIRSCARDVEVFLEHWLREELTLDQAAEESHLSKSTLQKKVAGGDIPNAGRKHNPRIQRQDVPKRRPVREPPTLENGDPDFVEKILREERQHA